MRKHWQLNLAFRLIKKQRLRTAAVFCGIFLSAFLLHAFCSLGWYFLKQVCAPESNTTTAAYGSGYHVLTALAVLLFLTVCSCSAILLHQLISLTFLQKWNGLRRLITLGASRKDILFMTAAEFFILCGTALFASHILIFVAAKYINYSLSVCLKKPLWLTGCIDIWLSLLSCFLLVLPVLRAFRRPLHTAYAQSAPPICKKGRRISAAGISRTGFSFALFLSKKYSASDRRRHFRIVLTVTAAVLLYVPSDYLIRTNIKADKEGLNQKHGITYTCSPSDASSLHQSVNECRRLMSAADSKDSVLYVRLPGSAVIPAGLLSRSLLAVLKKAGWQNHPQLNTSCDIYFLEDQCYSAYSRTETNSAILVNRYTNRTSWQKDADPAAIETPLLHARTDKLAAVEIYCGIPTSQADTRPRIHPDVCFEQFPEGIRTGNVTLILPLSSLTSFCNIAEADQESYPYLVCGLFADKDETLFPMLQESLGRHPAGTLTYTRREYQKWYRSLREIHLAALCISSLLFFTALLHIFFTILFHCMERRHTAAILWSLGLTQKIQTAILTLETLRGFLFAILTGIPASGILSYIIYTVYRSVWNIRYALPLKQFLLILAAAGAAAAVSAVLSRHLLKHQDFLQEIRNIL